MTLSPVTWTVYSVSAKCGAARWGAGSRGSTGIDNGSSATGEHFFIDRPVGHRRGQGSLVEDAIG